jgi:hypothetical protein
MAESLLFSVVEPATRSAVEETVISGRLEAVEPPSLSVAVAETLYEPKPGPFQVKLNWLPPIAVPAPSLELSAKKSTLFTVPSLSVAVAIKVMFAGVVN